MNRLRILALATGLILSGGARGESPFGPFSDPNFPFHTCTLDLRNLGEGFAKENLVPRAIILKLGKDHYACWDPDLLRVAAFWKGGFVEMGGMAANSYHPENAKKKVSQGMGSLPKIIGEPIFTNGMYPGWSTGKDINLNDPRMRAPNPKETGLGGLPLSHGRWNGIYRTGKNVVLSYTVGDMPIQESIECDNREFTSGLVRSFRFFKKAKKTLSLIACEVPGAYSHKVDSKTNTALLYDNKRKDTVTAVGVFSPREKINLRVHENRHILLNIPKGTVPTMLKVVTWRGRTEQLPAFYKMLRTGVHSTNVKLGGMPLWFEVEQTFISEPKEKAAYIIEDIPLPLPNRWKRNIRPAAITKLAKGIFATVTFDGDVWLIYGLMDDNRKLTWKRYAAGLHEPLSIEVVDGKIHVFTRNGIIRLHDFNNDKEADFYENFCNLFGQTAETREFASSFAKHPEGGFILTKGGQQTASHGRHNNHLLRVSADGKHVSKIAYGLRQGFANTHPDDGRIYATDQQGHYIPSTPVHLIAPKSFLGFKEPDHDGKFPSVREPLCWVPHKTAPSGTHMVWTAQKGFGPLNDRLLLVDYHNPGLLQVFQDLSGKQPQGGVHRLPFDMKSPSLKACVDPDSGDLYLAGLQVFGSKAREIAGISRIRHTSQPSFLPTDARINDKGLLLTFNQPLDLTGTTREHIKVQRWNYKRTKKYGSGHYLLDGKPGQESLPLANVFLSNDARRLFIAVPEMKPVHQIEVAFKLQAQNKMKIDDKVWLTAHHLPEFDPVTEKFKRIPLRETLPGNAQGPNLPSDRISKAAGEKLYTNIGCIGCHTLDGQRAGRPGPSWKGIFGTKRRLTNNKTAVADENYLRESILNPGSKILEGFQDNEVAMPPYKGILTDSQVDSLVLFIKSL
jgi:mono/diheme cytochrome c family protein